MPGISRDSKISDLEREFHDLMKKLDPHYKSELIRINISSSFMTRARCLKCGNKPEYYFAMRMPSRWFDVRDLLLISKWLRKYINRMTDDWYLDDKPHHFTNIKEFSFKLDDNHYEPTLHRSRFSNKEKDKMIEFISCHCGFTVWAFNQKSVQNRPEIINRKGKYTYPNRFEY
jgi:hypothetical protein